MNSRVPSSYKIMPAEIPAREVMYDTPSPCYEWKIFHKIPQNEGVIDAWSIPIDPKFVHAWSIPIDPKFVHTCICTNYTYAMQAT